VFADNLLVSYLYDRWSYLKFVMDPATEKYVRCIFSGAEYDLSAYDVWSGNSGLASVIDAFARADNREAVAKSVWFDDLILTSAEPI